MNTYLSVAEIDMNIVPDCIIQGRVLIKSKMLVTKHNTQYFWCIISDKKEKQSANKKQPNQIKIMCWYPFSIMFYEKIKQGKIYDFKEMSVQETKKSYHEHSYQLIVTKNTNIQQKKTLTLVKNGILCNEPTKFSNNKIQINIKHYFKKL